MACKDDHTRKNIRVERARTGKFFPRGKGSQKCNPFPRLYSRPCFGGGMMLASSCNGGGCGTRRQRPCAFDCKCLPCYSTGQCLHELKRKQEGRDTKGTYKRDNSKIWVKCSTERGCKNTSCRAPKNGPEDQTRRIALKQCRPLSVCFLLCLHNMCTETIFGALFLWNVATIFISICRVYIGRGEVASIGDVVLQKMDRKHTRRIALKRMPPAKCVLLVVTAPRQVDKVPLPLFYKTGPVVVLSKKED